MRKQLTLLFFGLSSLHLYAQPANDNFASAIDVTANINGCSADAAYTTVNATGDLNPGSTWNTLPDYNVWFSFTAPASGILTATVDRGGVKGTIRRTQIAIWQNDGTTEINSNRYVNDNDVVSTTAFGLTPGATYYISVDNNYSGYRGTFTLCLSDAADYDFYEGAIDVTGLINACSADEAYTTLGATSDKNPGSTWNTTPDYNRWFSFTATASGMITVTIDRGGTKGTLRRAQVAIWQNDGITEINSNRYVNDNDVVSTTALGLTPGATYYISVDNNYNGYRGTFTLCLSDAADYDFYEGAIDVTGLINSCSADEAYTTIGATGDKNPGSCWNSTVEYNRWFSFTAPASGMLTVTVDRGGSKGTLRRVQLAIWQSDGTTQVNCNQYVGDNDIVSTTALGLTPGATYYISVDNNYNGYRGTFTLCLSDAADYDFYEGALDVTGLINSCSADAGYTTIGATGDKNPGSCWNSTVEYNRWFSFTAPASGMLTVTVDRGGSKGTLRRVQLAIWQSDGTTQVNCNQYVGDNDIVSTTALGLTPGATYYISVDNNYSGYRGTFTLCLSDAADYDFYEGAFPITDLTNWCSSDAQFTTIGATPDKNPGGCWNSAAEFNRWFRFVASASGMLTVTVDRGGSKGTLRRTQVAIWQSNGTTQVSCNQYVGDNDVVSTTALGLTPGATYYISVDNNYSGYRGTFTLCVTDQADYDFYEGAIELTDLNNWCSADAAYTTIGATSDKNAASCWNTSPNFNRWFRFTAITPNVTISVNRGGSLGTIRRINLALFAANGTTQVACSRYVSDNDNVSIVTGGLTVGATYYISVDNNYSGYRGTFTLCIDNVDETYYSIGSGAWTSGANWSLVSHAGPAAGSYPTIGDVANIEGHTMTITSAVQAAEVNLNAVTNNVGLTISNGSLSLAGQFNITNPGNNLNATLTVANSTLSVNDDFVVNRNGGTSIISAVISNSTVSINRNFTINSTAGNGDNTIGISTLSNFIVGGQMTLLNSGGPKSSVSVDNSDLSVRDNLNFTATTDNRVELLLSTTADLLLGRNIVRGTPAYGILTSSGNSRIHYNSSGYLQTMASSNGSGTGDAITYENVIIQNTRVTTPQITLGGPVTVNGNFTLNSGIVSTTSTNILNLKNNTVTSIGSTSSYVDGPMTYEVASGTANTTRNFPLGDNGSYRPAILSVTHSDATSVVYTAEHIFSSAGALGYTLPGTIERVSGVRYWTINRSAVANLTSARVTLYYGIGTSDGVTDPPNLRVVKTNGAGTAWFDVGGTGSASGTGTITSGPFTSFSLFTLGNSVGGVNPLPVELTDFKAKSQSDGTVLLSWVSASELNNDYYTLERSPNGFDFSLVGQLEGAGTTNAEHLYSLTDEQPYSGISYYRLKQTDFDGTEKIVRLISFLREGNTDPFTVFPNPAGNEIVHFNSKASVRIYNSLNQFIMEVGSVDKFDASSLASGVYILRNHKGEITRLVIH